MSITVDWWLRVGAIVFASVALVWGAFGVFSRLKQTGKGFGPNSLQALAIVFFLPCVVVVASISEIKDPAIAALFGTVAGYILSSPKREDKPSNDTNQDAGKHK
jgi:hypothetical protein